MATMETDTTPVVQEDSKTPESKSTEAKNAKASSETVVENDDKTVNSEAVNTDGTAVNSKAVDNNETVKNDTVAEAEEDVGAASGEAAPSQSSENTSSTEPKTSFLDSLLNKSRLGKVMGGRKKKEQCTAGGGEENAAEGGEKEGEKGEEAAMEGAEGDTEVEKSPENEEKEEDEKKADKGKAAEVKSTVRDLIRRPVARIFSHRSTDKKDGAEPQKKVKVRSKSLDRLEDAEALNTTADSTVEEGGAAEAAEGDAKGGAGEGAEEGADGGTEEGDQKTSSATTKHMKRWHSFKKLMAQKTHKKGGGAGEDVKEEGEGEGGGGDSSTLDSKESGQKRWKLKRSWTFQGLKRDTSLVGISSKTKSSDKDSAEKAGEAEGAEEAKVDGEAEEDKGEGVEEKAEGGEDDKAGGGTVTQHANEIWTSFKKRVKAPKTKRTNTECGTGEEDSNVVAPGEDGVAEEGKAKGKRSHFGRAVSLKNFILRKGKSSSVDMGEAKEEETAEGGEGEEAVEATEEAVADGEAAAETKEINEKGMAEAEKMTPAKGAVGAPVTNGENECSNGMAEENTTHNHQDEENKKGISPVKKSKDAGGAKEEANAKLMNATAAVNSDKKAGNV